MKYNWRYTLGALLIWSCTYSVFGKSFDYPNQWKHIAEFEAKGLPKSALQCVDSLMHIAKQEKNSPQYLKGWLYRCRFLSETDKDTFEQELKRMEYYASHTNEKTEKAFLHSMIAKLYEQYFLHHQFQIKERSVLSGYRAENLREWDASVFADTVAYHIKASLAEATQLQATPATSYDALIEKGDDSRLLQPTLFDFLCARGVEILTSFSETDPLVTNNLQDSLLFTSAKTFTLGTSSNASYKDKITDIYRRWLAFRLTEKNEEALVYTDLQRLNYIYNNFQTTQKDDLYCRALSGLKKEHSSSEAVVEILAEQANYYLQHDRYDSFRANETAAFLDYKRRAFVLCEEGIRRFPKYKRISILHTIRQRITIHAITLSGSSNATPDSLYSIKISGTNIANAEIRLYAVATSAQEDYKNRATRYVNRLSDNTRLILTKQIALPIDSNFRATDTTIVLPTQNYGMYEYTVGEVGVTNPEKLSYGNYTVSDIAFFTRSIVNGLSEIYVVNRTTGHPINEATVSVFNQSGYGNKLTLSPLGSLPTDKNGHALVHTAIENQNSILQVKKGTDSFLACQPTSFYYPENIKSPEARCELNIFTDRSIYRPGQTVYFKGIAWIATKESSQVCRKQKYTISLENANYQDISSQTLQTNDFGSFTGSFVLPKNCLNGNFMLVSSGHAAISFRVEEYKRPTFEISFDTLQGTHSFGDIVHISGKVNSYANFTIANATVKYRIVRRPHWLSTWWNTPETEEQNGQTTTTDKGAFSLTFMPQRDPSASIQEKLFYTYSIIATVTDTNGETQTKEMTFSIGDRSMILSPEISESVNKALPLNIAIKASNLDGNPVTATVHYCVSLLKPDRDYAEQINREDLTHIDKQIIDGTINTPHSKQLTIANISQWPSGKYLLTLSCKDDQNREITSSKSFEIYAKEDKQLPVKRYLWVNEEKTSCKPGETPQIRCGTSAHDAKILYEMLVGNSVTEHGWIEFDNEIKTIKTPPFQAEWENNASVRLTLVKDGRYFSKTIPLKGETARRVLNPTFSVFRNKLLPSTKEEWSVTIPELKNSSKQAECMIAMYDASLTNFTPQEWEFEPIYRPHTDYISPWNFIFASSVVGSSQYSLGKNYYTAHYALDRFDNIFYDLFSNNAVGITPRSKSRKTYMEKVQFNAARVSTDTTMVTRDFAAMTPNLTQRKSSKSNDMATNLQPDMAAKIRSDFSETGFFYPQLYTNASGDLTFSFTVPESLTRWNVMGLAHTQDLYVGQWQAQTVTQKPFMIQPNLPRFVRENDQLSITAKLINLSDKQQQGKVRIELIDPETDKLISEKNTDLTFDLEAGTTKTVSWSLNGFAHKSLLICKVTASTDNFSDGEQHYIPVLPDKIRVTETLSMRVRGNESKHYTFERLQSEKSHVDTKSLTAEITTNPAWYALQALPSLRNPDNDCSISWFTSYYSNTLAAAIAQNQPKLAETYAQWQTSRSTLKSNLEKNEELKNLLLTETPWITEAKNETEQKQRLAELFDRNQQADKQRMAMDKLIALQSANGGFPWFKGMSEDRFLTQYIAEGMARLQKMNAVRLDAQQTAMLKKAIAFADEQMDRDFIRLKQSDNKWQELKMLTPSQIYYFYMRSSFENFPLDKKTTEAVSFYQKRLASSWASCSLLGKALIAITAQRQGDKKLATDIARSLVENATVSDEKGMYWANNRGGIWWHESNIITHTAIMEALQEIDANTQQIDEMKMWLLSQKQTERWHSPIATADAVYAFLSKGSNWLTGSNKISLQLGDIAVKPDTQEAGTGYSKTSIEAHQITPSMGNITLSSQEAHPAWASLYWQYETSSDKVSAQKSNSLSVDKKLFIERTSSKGLTLTPIDQNQPLQVGDKVTVQLTIHTDRDMEYVALSDQRAACLEPTEQLSGCRWKDRLLFYQSTKDASSQFFISYLPKGSYILEYSAWVTRQGIYNNGIATIQCMYAPEFSSHTAGGKLIVK